MFEGRYLRNIELGANYKRECRKYQSRVNRASQGTGSKICKTRYMRQNTCMSNKDKSFIVMGGQGNSRHPWNGGHLKTHTIEARETLCP